MAKINEKGELLIAATSPIPVDAEFSGTVNVAPPAKASAAAPTHVEGTEVPLSVDLDGSLRIAGVAKGIAVVGRSTTAVALRFTVSIEFTET